MRNLSPAPQQEAHVSLVVILLFFVSRGWDEPSVIQSPVFALQYLILHVLYLMVDYAHEVGEKAPGARVLSREQHDPGRWPRPLEIKVTIK